MFVYLIVFFLGFYSLKLAVFLAVINMFLDYSWELDFHLVTAFATLISVSISVIILLSMFSESILFLQYVSLSEFLFGLTWKPQFDGLVSMNFGIIPLVVGTILISVIAIAVAFPLGLATAVYLAYYGNKKFASFIYPLLNLLAIIPTIIYGLFAITVLAPWLNSLNSNIASDSALIIGITIGIMITPVMITMSFEGIKSISRDLYKVSYSLGANETETLLYIILPAAWASILNAGLLAFSRAMGETMIVVMVASLRPTLSLSPFASVSTITAQIVNLLTGDIEFNSPIILSAFALGVVLFTFTMLVNALILKVTNRYQYDVK